MSNEQPKRERRTLQVPLPDTDIFALIQIPYPISEADWQQLMDYLMLTKRALMNSPQEVAHA